MDAAQELVEKFRSRSLSMVLADRASPFQKRHQDSGRVIRGRPPWGFASFPSRAHPDVALLIKISNIPSGGLAP
jgi:hypothetical protein